MASAAAALKMPCCRRSLTRTHARTQASKQASKNRSSRGHTSADATMTTTTRTPALATCDCHWRARARERASPPPAAATAAAVFFLGAPRPNERVRGKNDGRGARARVFRVQAGASCHRRNDDHARKCTPELPNGDNRATKRGTRSSVIETKKERERFGKQQALFDVEMRPKKNC